MAHENSHDDMQALPEDLRALHDALMRVGEDMRATLPRTENLIQQVYVVAGNQNHTITQLADEDFVLEVSPLPPVHDLSPKKSSQERRWLRGVSAVAAVVIIIVFAQFIFGRLIAHPNTTSGNNLISQDQLFSVSMTSPDDGWAIGSHININARGSFVPAGSKIMMYHFQHGRWVPSEVQGAPAGIPGDGKVSMISPSDGWAISILMISSDSLGQQTLLLHYDGKRWARVSAPTLDYFGDIQMLAPDDGWLSGWDTSNGLSNQTIFHYDGHSWQPQQLLASSAQPAITSFDMLNANEGWAVAGDPVAPSRIFRFSNGSWSLYTEIRDTDITRISMTTAQEGWAIGSNDNSGVLGAIYHYHDGKWSHVPTPAGLYVYNPDPNQGVNPSFNAIRMLSTDDGWIAGNFGSPTKPRLLLHYDGHSWSQVDVPSLAIADPQSTTISINDITFIPSGNEGWAVGTFSHSTSSAANNPIDHETILFLHYLNGVWSVYSGP